MKERGSEGAKERGRGGAKERKSEGERERKRERGGSGCNGSKIGLEAIVIIVVITAIVTNEAKHELILQHLNDRYT